MADRYWVGGAGTWDATTTTNWSATSGGAGGASAPTSADNVIFNTLSNAIAYAVTVGTNANALDITIAGPAVGNVTITSGATAVINCYGSWTNAATGIVFTTTTGAAINFLATTTGKTITTNNLTLAGNAITFNGVGGGWTQGSAFTSTSTFGTNNGAFSTGNFALNTGSLVASGTATRSITLGTSTVTCTAASFINIANANGLTFNADTSTIIGNSTSNTLNGGGLTYYNVSFTGVTALTHTIQGTNSFNNLTFTSRTTDGVGSINISANQTISGTLTLGAANTAVRRLFVRSDTIGTQRTLTVATIATLADVDFQDTVAAGASGTFSGTRLGNCTNNSNITFAAGANKYWNLAGAQNWSAVAWATSSGGAPAVNNFPLAQDTAIFDNTGSVTGTITIQIGWNLPAISITKTGAMTLANGTQTPRLFGSLTLQAATVTTGTGAWSYAAYGVASTFTSNTATFTPPLTINAPTGTATLADGFTQPSTVTTIMTAGTLDLVSYTLTTGLFSSTNSNTRVIAFGTGKIVLTATSGGIWTTSTSTNLTVTGTNPLIQATVGGAGTRAITMGAAGETNAISVDVTSGSDIVSFATTSGSYRNVNFTGFTGTFNIANSISVFGNWNFGGVTLVSGSSTISFAATSGTKTITSNGVSFPASTNFNGVGGTFQLQDGCTVPASNTTNLTNGTLDLVSHTLSTGLFASANSNTRALAFGTGKMVLTGLDTGVYTTTTGTGLTMTGTRTIEVTGVGLLGDTRTISGASTFAGGVAANAANFYIQAGADIISLGTANRVYGTLDFTGFSGSTLANIAPQIYGDLVLSSDAGFSVTGGTNTWGFLSTTAQTITTNGKTIDNDVTFNGIGGSWAMQDALTLGSTRALTMTNGTLQLKSGTTNTVGSIATSGTNQKFLSATTPGSQATLSQASGTVSVSYLTIQDSAATGGAVFQSYLSNLNVDAGNNTGWNFGNVIAGNVITETATGTDTVVSIAAFVNSLQEAATGTDAINGRPFWDVINNTQTANWSAISTT